MYSIWSLRNTEKMSYIHPVFRNLHTGYGTKLDAERLNMHSHAEHENEQACERGFIAPTYIKSRLKPLPPSLTINFSVTHESLQ